MVKRARELLECQYHGLELRTLDGPVTTSCSSCGTRTRLKLFNCDHPQRLGLVVIADCEFCPYSPIAEKKEWPLSETVRDFISNIQTKMS